MPLSRSLALLAFRVITTKKGRIKAREIADEERELFVYATREVLGPNQNIPTRLKSAVWVGSYIDTIIINLTRTFGITCLWVTSTGLTILAFNTTTSSWKEIFEARPPSLTPEVFHDFVEFISRPYATVVLLCWVTPWLIGSTFNLRDRILLNVTPDRLHITRLHRVPYLTFVVIGCCYHVIDKFPHHSRTSIRDVDMAIGLLLRELQKIHSDKSLLPRRSPRRAALKEHVNLVTTALQTNVTRLDSDPRAAAKKIASMTLSICEAWVTGRKGQLLSDLELHNLEPARNREALRIAAAGTITLSCTYLGAALGAPSVIIPLILGLVGVISFNVIVGRTPRALSLLDSMRGIQRP